MLQWTAVWILFPGECSIDYNSSIVLTGMDFVIGSHPVQTVEDEIIIGVGNIIHDVAQIHTWAERTKQLVSAPLFHQQIWKRREDSDESLPSQKGAWIGTGRISWPSASSPWCSEPVWSWPCGCWQYFNQRLTIPMFGRCRVHRHGNDAVISYLWCSN